MSVPLTLLGLLERESSYGYDLKRDYDTYFGWGRALPFGQVYATLSRLARDGKVSAGQVEPGAGPDRKRYSITELGASEVEEWLRTPIQPEPHLQTLLFTKGVHSLIRGRSARTYLDTQRAAHMERMRQRTELGRTSGSVAALLADLGLLHVESVRGWIERT
jgi:DNA-binding PadR family transcriptional regulator